MEQVLDFWYVWRENQQVLRRVRAGHVKFIFLILLFLAPKKLDWKGCEEFIYLFIIFYDDDEELGESNYS